MADNTKKPESFKGLWAEFCRKIRIVQDGADKGGGGAEGEEGGGDTVGKGRKRR